MKTARWSYTADVEPNDKSRLRGFVKNEISYYNALLLAFSSRLRTSPQIFSEISEELVGAVAAAGRSLDDLTEDNLPKYLLPVKDKIFSEGKLILSERDLLFLNAISSPIVLHPETKRAMAIEVLREHIRQAAALSRTSKSPDRELSHPVELLHQTDSRIKRHVQLPASAVQFNGDRTEIKTAYNSTPLKLNHALPKDAKWNIAIIRDDERPGIGGDWTVEFRQELTNFLPRLSDIPFSKKKRKTH